MILAHYAELEWVGGSLFDLLSMLTSFQTTQFGVDADLIRISVGLEDSADLVSRIERALAAASRTMGA